MTAHYRSNDVPAVPGTYVLQLEASTAQSVTIGKRGVLDVTPGVYLYVGSARGPGGLQARIRRHARASDKRLHWHIDYLRAKAELTAVGYARGAERRECQWAQALRAWPPTRMPMAGFGASDCTCSAHLFALQTPPSPGALQACLQASESDAPPIRMITFD